MIPARLRNGAQWSDVRILNISSRGLMIQSGRAGLAGSFVEVHRGDHIIAARVVWSDGSRAGLQSEGMLPVEQIMAASGSGALRLVASEGMIVERRKPSRSKAVDARQRGRTIEFAGAILAVLIFSLLVSRAAFDALASPMARASAALQPAAADEAVARLETQAR